MPKRPPLSGRDLVRALERLGFREVSQRGSHMKLRRDDTVCIVPHRKKGTLAGILRQAKVTPDELLKAVMQ